MTTGQREGIKMRRELARSTEAQQDEMEVLCLTAKSNARAAMLGV